MAHISSSSLQAASSREAPTVPPPPPGMAATAIEARADELEAFALKILARSREMRQVAARTRGQL